MSKQELRKKMREIREKQPAHLKEIKDKKILKRILILQEFKNAKEFFAYLSFKGEVSTDLLIKKFLGKKKIIVPKIEEDRIGLYELHKQPKFIAGKFGILEPVSAVPKKNWKKIDMAFIPGIAFDLRGHRIGFGRGYFDRLLKKLRCTTIGLAYEFQIVEQVPAQKYDVAVDYVVTDERVVRC